MKYDTVRCMLKTGLLHETFSGPLDDAFVVSKVVLQVLAISRNGRRVQTQHFDASDVVYS